MDINLRKHIAHSKATGWVHLGLAVASVGILGMVIGQGSANYVSPKSLHPVLVNKDLVT